MTDSNNRKDGSGKLAKFNRLFNRFLYWVSISFAILLTIALIVLRAPLVLPGFFVSILLIEWLAPKTAKKWIGIVICGVAVIFLIWVFLPDNNEDWRPFTFDAELAEMEAKRALPKEENAAVIYEKILETYDPNFFSDEYFTWGDIENYQVDIEKCEMSMLAGADLFDPNAPKDSDMQYLLVDENKEFVLNEFWSSKDYPEAAAWLKSNQQLIEQLLLASKKTECYFTVAELKEIAEYKQLDNCDEIFDFWLSKKYKWMRQMIDWRKLLIISVNNDIADGRIESAVEKYLAILQIAEHLCQQPVFTHCYIRNRTANDVLGKLNNLIVKGIVNSEKLQRIDDKLSGFEYKWEDTSRKMLNRDKLMLKSFVCALFYQINSEGQIRANRDPRSTLEVLFVPACTMNSTGCKPMNPASFFQTKLTKAMAVLSRAFLPSTPQKAAIVIDDYFAKYYAMCDADYDWQKEKEDFTWWSLKLDLQSFLKMLYLVLAIDWDQFHDEYLRTDAMHRGSRLLIALRGYKNDTGHWPENLAQIEDQDSQLLVDPINGGVFVYKLADDAFVLYSKGKDGIDDGGKSIVYGEYKKNKDGVEIKRGDISIWPREK